MALAPKLQRRKFGNGEILQPAGPAPVSAISQCLNRLQKSWKKKGNLAAILHQWDKIAGSQLAKNCQPLNLQRRTLIIGVSHPQWIQALQYNRPQLLASLNAAGHEIKEIRIKQYHPEKKKRLEDEKVIWERHPSRTDVHGLSNCIKCNSPCPSGENKLWGKCSFCRRLDLSEVKAI